MKLTNLFSRKPKTKSFVDTDQGWMNTNWNAGWWQQNLQPRNLSGKNEVVEACVSALSQTVSMCPIYHYRELPEGGEERLTGSRAERVMLNPNQYTTRTNFFNSIIRCMYFSANGYAVATRDGNRAIDALYLYDPSNMEPVLDPESGELFYWGSERYGSAFNPDTDVVHMARDVLHLRMNSDPKNPLKGQTPLAAAVNSVSASNAITGHQSEFYRNQARPSGILSTDANLSKEQMTQLRQAIEERSQGSNSGGVPVLGNGLKWQSMSLSSQDSQLVEAANMTVENISRVFRVPLPLINSMTGSTFNNAESMGRWFLASGLGFLLEHIELELGKLFGLPFGERLNFDTKALLRSDWKTQIESLGEGVLKGIYSPNEARHLMGMTPVADGDEPRVQQQVVPLSAWDKEVMVEPEPEPDTVEESLRAGVMKGLANVS